MSRIVSVRGSISSAIYTARWVNSECNSTTVQTNEKTLEHEIFAAGNEVFLKSVFLRLHRKSRSDWKNKIEDIAIQDRPDAFLKLIEAKKTRKGDLAQAIASQIDAGETFIVPTYLSNAIRGAAEV